MMRKKKKSTGLVALIFIAGGALFLMRNFGLLDFNIPWHYFSFALIPILIGLKALADRNYVFGAFITLIGIASYIPVFLTTAQRAEYVKLWPLALVLAGIWILLEKNRKFHKHHLNVNGGISEEDFIVEDNILSGSSKKYMSQTFRGGQIRCVMGGSELDLTGAKIISPAELDVDCVMGGLELRIPQDWNVEIRINPILGGVEDKMGGVTFNRDKLLIIKGTIVMGGIEILRF